jgi:hypothetical protein
MPIYFLFSGQKRNKGFILGEIALYQLNTAKEIFAGVREIL